MKFTHTYILYVYANENGDRPSNLKILFRFERGVTLGERAMNMNVLTHVCR
jgi:hypothetical protein